MWAASRLDVQQAAALTKIDVHLGESGLCPRVRVLRRLTKPPFWVGRFMTAISGS